VMTSAGTAAGIDLCLHLVALDHGVDVAVRVARRIVMPAYRAGGQAQYVEQPIDLEPVAAPLAELLEWARQRIDGGVGVDDLARRAAVSSRTLTRRFRAEVGLPPGAWLRRERLLLAQRLIETHDEPLALISRRAGYASPTTMRAQFAALLGTSPRAYRQTFRPPLI
jgi:transcriptional regulator GlxA family with amidase domain